MRRILVVMVLAVAACGDDTAEPPPRATQPPPDRSGPDIGAQRARSERSIPGRGTVVPSDDRRSRPPWVRGGGRFPDRRGRQVMSDEAARRSAEAIVAARSDDDSPCGQAFDALSRFVEDFQEDTPWVPGRRPERERFMEMCTALPRPLQQCMVPSYHRANEAECEQVRARWPRMTGSAGMDAPEEGREG